MKETSTKTAAVADEACETPRSYTRGHEDYMVDAAISIGLVVNVPQPGVNACMSPFIASGSVSPSNCLLSARIVTPNGTLPGNRLPGDPLHPNNWRFSFPSDPPHNVSCSFVVDASDGNGQTREIVVPFSCGPLSLSPYVPKKGINPPHKK
jgi:hypothetical protein